MSALRPPDGVPAWAWAKLAREDGHRWAIVERDASGEVIGTAFRDADGGKTFAPGGKRGLIVAWPLDSYAGASADAPVFVAEGASDTAALWGLGLDAVGVPMAGQGGDMLAELVAKRHVVIIADADEAGRRGATKIAAALVPVCASVRVIEPPERAKDARAAVIVGADARAFMGLAAAAECITPTRALADGAPIVVRMADVESKPVEWLWPSRIPRRCVTVLAGRPGDGKSFATADWAARVSTARAWPDGSPCEAGDVLLVSGRGRPGDHAAAPPGRPRRGREAGSPAAGRAPGGAQWQGWPVHVYAGGPSRP